MISLNTLLTRTIFSLMLLAIIPAAFGALTDNNTAYWTFDNNVTDSINGITLNNVTTIVNSTGKINSGRNFTYNNGGYLWTNDSNVLTNGDRTACAWIYPTDVSTWRIYYATIGRLEYAGPNGNRIHWTKSNDGGGQTLSSANSLQNGNWYFVCLVKNETITHTIYINGVKDSNTTAAWGVDSGASTALRIGAYNDAGASINYQGTLDEFSFWKRALTQAEIQALYNSGSPGSQQQYPYTGPASPAVSLVDRSPGDITSTSLFTTTLNLTYNVTLLVPVYNASNPYLNYTVSNGRTAWEYANGTTLKGGIVKKVFSTNVTTDQYIVRLTDQDVYPGTYTTDPDIIEATGHGFASLTSNNDYAMVDLYNVTNATQYNFFEIMANSTGANLSLTAYYCNSTYTTGNPSTSTNCANFGEITARGTYNHTENQSQHQLLPLTINTTSGRVGSVRVTSNSRFVVRGANGATWQVHYANISIRPNASLTTTNGGNAWTGVTSDYAFDAHLHQFNGTDVLTLYSCAQNTTNETCSVNASDTLDVTPLSPSSVTFYTPNATYGRFVLINWTSATTFNSSITITNYSLSLINESGGSVGTIKQNNGVATSYNWNSYDLNLSTTQNYAVRVVTTDSNNLTSTSTSLFFNVTTNGLLNVSTRSAGTNLSILNTTAFEVVDNTNLSGFNQTATGSVLFDIVKGHNYTITAAIANLTTESITVFPSLNQSFAYTYHYNANSFFILIYNETTNNPINNTVPTSLEVITSLNATNYTFTGAGINVSFLTPSPYTLRYWIANQSDVPRDYYTTLVPNSAQNITLYVVDAAISQFYLPILVDDTLTPVANATAQLLRYFVGSNSYQVVEMATTDTTGQAVLRVVPNSVYYKIIWSKDGKTTTTTPAKITAQTNTYTINLRSSPFASFDASKNLYVNLNFTNGTSTFVYTWSDTSSVVTAGCMIVRDSMDGVTRIVYDGCAAGSVGSIPYTVANRSHTYAANAWLQTNTEFSDLGTKSLTIAPPTARQVFGLVGIFVAVLVVIAFAIIGGEAGTRGTVISGLFGLLFLGVYGIIAFRPEVIIGVVLIAGIIVYKIRG